MKILVVGSGGREHAICEAFERSDRVTEIYCADGNAGIADIAERVSIRPDQIEELATFAFEKSIDLTFVGGEIPLSLGIVDEFESRGSKIVGASGAAARLEASKAFSKEFMDRHRIPTAGHRVAGSVEGAVGIIESGTFGDEFHPVVVKADGLAAGKGVVVAANRSEAIAALADIENVAGKEASRRIVLEECLKGKEVSVIMFADGGNFALMPPTRDHKRIGEGDTGPNTGGMGTFTDDSLIDTALRQEIVDTIITPTLEGCRAEGFPFRGILFLGLMLTEDGPKVLEYNVRFGDPETQSILVRLETDLVEICEAMLEERLDQISIDWTPGCSATIVLAAKGYPVQPRKGDLIKGLDAVTDAHVFHAGTARGESGEFVTAGGRVVGVTAMGDTLEATLETAYREVAKISWAGMQYRRDIGK